MNKVRTSAYVATLALCLVSLFAASCGANESVLRSGNNSAAPAATAEPRIDSFENDLADVKRAEFTWLFVIRRRDGGVLTGQDKSLVRANTGDANRRVLAADELAIIVGSNFEITLAGIEKLKKQFNITDLSTGKPSEDPAPLPTTEPKK